MPVPSNPSVRIAVGAVAIAAALAGSPVDTTARQTSSTPAASFASTRVRTDDLVLARTIHDATQRSPTFQRLVEAIMATDGIVYVERGRCGSYVRSCLKFWMVEAGPYRLLRIVVDVRKGGSDAVAAIAHELQHALEVLENPRVRTGTDMHNFFQRHGLWRGYSFETLAAIATGDAVRQELTERRPDN